MVVKTMLTRHQQH